MIKKVILRRKETKSFLPKEIQLESRMYLSSVYKDRIEPIFQTENFLLPKRKPITEQMDSLQ